MPITRLSPSEAREAIQEWTKAVETLFRQVEGWIAETRAGEWQVSFLTAEVTEESLGSYITHVMEISAGKGNLVLEPVGWDVYGAQGRVDLYAWPSLFRVMLLHRSEDAAWIIRTESGIDWPQPWSEPVFLAIAEQLLSAA